MSNKATFYFLAVGTGIFFLLSYVSFVNASTSTLNEKDYLITNFGIKNGNPIISVEGIAGGSYDASMGDEGYQAYVFDTDKGIFQITVSEGSSNKPYYSTDQLLVKEIKLDECLPTKETQGKPLFDNNTVQFVDHKLDITKVNKAHAIQVTLDDPDDKCETGQHIRKIYPMRGNLTNTTKTENVETAAAQLENNTIIEGSPGAVDINTSSGEYQCNGASQKGKISALYVDAYDRHGNVSGDWTLVNEKREGEDTTGKITAGSVSTTSYLLHGKAIKDMICPTIYDKIAISGECGDNMMVEMKTSDGRPIASLKGNASCSPG
ncbi:MAG TPA: hypothetical protein VH415_17405 [Nitrososphaeraceae archaeon]|jgi:hypothetical protein